MEVMLSPDAQKFIEQKIEEGEFASASELLEEAISLLRDLPRWTDSELRHEVQRGIDQLAQGESAPWDAADLKRRVRDGIRESR